MLFIINYMFFFNESIFDTFFFLLFFIWANPVHIFILFYRPSYVNMLEKCCEGRALAEGVLDLWGTSIEHVNSNPPRQFLSHWYCNHTSYTQTGYENNRNDKITIIIIHVFIIIMIASTNIYKCIYKIYIHINNA